MSKKLEAKASLIQIPSRLMDASTPPHGLARSPAEGQQGRPERRLDMSDARIKTAPGSMAHFMATQSAAVKEAGDLRERLQAFEGASPVRALDPRCVQASRWANRHVDSYADAAYAALKLDIGHAGGNVQPVKVRPLVLNGSTPPRSALAAAAFSVLKLAAAETATAPMLPSAVVSTADAAPAGLTHGVAMPSVEPTTTVLPQAAYELVYGHRRHRACLELGLPVLALVEAVSDQELFEAMERENRGRKNLSAWEQGAMYKRALDDGLYASQRKLSEALGVDVSIVSKSLALARLPTTVVQAFASPLDIQFRWAQPLAEAIQRDPDAVLSRALRLKASAAALTKPWLPARVLAALVGLAEMPPVQADGSTVLERGLGPVLNRSTPSRRVLRGKAGREAVMSRDAQGRVVVRFAAGALDEQGENAVAELLSKWLSKA